MRSTQTGNRQEGPAADHNFDLKSLSLRQNIVNNPFEAYLPKDPEQRAAFLKESYGNSYQDIKERLGQLGSKYDRLIEDPGIVQYLSEFEAFIKNQPNLTGKNLIEVREEFSQQLGNMTLYRGSSLTEQEFKVIDERGNVKPRKELPNENLKSIPDIIAKHCHPVHPNSGIIQSATTYIDNAVGMGPGINAEAQGRSLYLLHLEVPKVDVLDLRKAPFSWTENQKKLRQLLESKTEGVREDYLEKCTYGDPNNKVLGITHADGTQVYRSIDSGVELFLFGEHKFEKIIKVDETNLAGCQLMSGEHGCWIPRQEVPEAKIDAVKDLTLASK